MNKVGLSDCARGFIDSFAGTLEAHSLTRFSTALREIDTSSVQRGPLAAFQHDAMQYLRTLLPFVADNRMQCAASGMDWGQVYDGGGIDSALAEGMLAAQAAGTYGVFAAQQVACGFFLLAPNVHYPLHTHVASEVYYCLTGEIAISHRLDESPIELSAGQLSETPAGRLHALQTGAKPVLLAYIWIGDISAPTWWWQRDDEGRWMRTAWRRKPGESWRIDRLELLSQADYEAAMI